MLSRASKFHSTNKQLCRRSVVVVDTDRGRDQAGQPESGGKPLRQPRLIRDRESAVRPRRDRRRQPDVVPPRNAVLGKHHRGVVAQQRLQSRRQPLRPFAFSVLMTNPAGQEPPGRRSLSLSPKTRHRPRGASSPSPSPPQDAPRASRRRHHARPAPAAPQNGCRPRPRRRCRFMGCMT